MNVLPMIALSTAAIGFFGATGHADRHFETPDRGEMTTYAASPQLSVHDLMERAPQSVAEPFCDVTASLTATLAHDFAETERSAWVQGRDMALQLWASDVMATWTLLHVGQDGIACVVSSGTGWTAGTTTDDILAMANPFGA